MYPVSYTHLDGEEEMILDLSVKKNMKRGWMENFMGGYGSKDRYELANTCLLYTSRCV